MQPPPQQLQLFAFASTRGSFEAYLLGGVTGEPWLLLDIELFLLFRDSGLIASWKNLQKSSLESEIVLKSAVETS